MIPSKTKQQIKILMEQSYRHLQPFKDDFHASRPFFAVNYVMRASLRISSDILALLFFATRLYRTILEVVQET